MKILTAIDKLSMEGTTPSCIALNLRDMYPAFLARGVTMTVCNLCGDDPGADLLEAAGVPTLRLGLASYSPRVLSALKRAVRDTGANLIHAHGYAAANYGRFVGWRLGLPVVVHEHAVLRVRPHQYLCDRLCRHWTTRGVAISRAVADFMVRGRSIPSDRIEIVHNGIDLARFERAAAIPAAEARASFGLPAQGPVVGCAARFRQEKGLHVLLEAAARLVPSYPELRFALAGEGSQKTRLQAWAEEHGLRGRVFFPGFVDDMPRFLRAINLLAIPSLSEGLSFAAMEAMAVGTPLVASHVGGLPEIVSDGDNGLLVPPADATALATAIERMLGDSALNARLIAGGRRAAAEFGLERYADRMTQLYRALIEHPDAVRPEPHR